MARPLVAVAPPDERIESPLYTVREAAWFVDVPRRTLHDWIKPPGAANAPLVTAEGGRKGSHHAVVPFVGLTEAFVVRAFRRVSDMKMDYLREVLLELERIMGIQHALASDKLRAHGRAILIDISKKDSPVREYVEVLTKNQVFDKVVEGHLKRITYRGGWARRFPLPLTPDPVVQVDPGRAFGQPTFIRGGARMVDVLNRFHARESLAVISRDFSVSQDDILEIVRATSRKATREED